MADHDKVPCVRVFGPVEVQPERYAFGFAHTSTLPPDVSATRPGEALRGLGTEKIERLPLEWA